MGRGSGTWPGVASCDLGAVGSLNVDLAVVVAPDLVALLFPPVVPAASRRPVSGVGSSAFGVVVQMVGLASSCGDPAAGPETFSARDSYGIACEPGEQSGGAHVDHDTFGIDDNSANLVLYRVGKRFGRIE